jgi:hypothetical protein
MSRKRLLWVVAVAAAVISAGGYAYSQTVNPDGVPGPTNTAGGVFRNPYQQNEPAAEPNKLPQPLSLTPRDRELALQEIDQHLGEQVAILRANLKNVLPDELSILTKTVNWTADRQNALLVALRAGDPAAVYEAWTQGNPQDIAGAELAARQTDVRRTLARMEQDVKNKAPLNQDIDDMERSLQKIALATPVMQEMADSISSLKTWAEARRLVDTSVTDPAQTAKLPTGEVPLIFDSGLDIGKAVVLGNGAVLIGNHGRGPMTIRLGNAVAALGLPVITDRPLPDASGQEVASGTLLINPANSGTSINYNVNGNRYVAAPGTKQVLPEGYTWVVEYDRGGGMGPASYTVTPGTYYFTPTDHGWQLYRQRFDVVLDNTKNSQAFYFLFNGQSGVVPPNGTQTISSIYPMVLRFDRGNGSELVAKSLNYNGTVEIGVNATDNRWDLFPTTDGQRNVSSLRLFR